jgi:hypothetical protein
MVTDNITMETQEKSQQDSQVQLSDVPVTDENSALNIIVSYLHIAQKRGAFNLQESSKLWECVRMFMKQ